MLLYFGSLARFPHNIVSKLNGLISMFGFLHTKHIIITIWPWRLIWFDNSIRWRKYIIADTRFSLLTAFKGEHGLSLINFYHFHHYSLRPLLESAYMEFQACAFDVKVLQIVLLEKIAWDKSMLNRHDQW